MLCSKCGAPITPGSASCPNCKASTKSLKTKETNPESEAQGKNAPAWFKLFLVVVILGSIAIGYHFFSPSTNLSSLVQAQLAAIRSNHIDKAYYNFTSQEYQAKYPLNSFKELVNTHPVLYENKNAHFYEQSADNQMGILAGTLIAQDNSTAPVIYRFTKEGGGWKIIELQILESGAMKSSGTLEVALADSKNSKTKPQEPSKVTIELKKTIEAQLQALQNGNIEKAYEDFVSKEFRQATPLDAFKDFIKSYPELTKHKSVTYGEGKIENNQGKISATLVTESQSYPIEYVLVKEDNAWKVWGFRMLNPLPKQGTAETSPTAQNEEPKELKSIIERHLNALKSNQLTKAYEEDISPDFKEVTSVEAYKDFVKNYPELTTFQSIKIGTGSSENDLWIIPVTLKFDKGESQLDFRLSKDGNQWKIWGINIVSSASHPKIDEKDKQALAVLIEAQLDALRKNDLSKAYYAFVSKDFEKATSFEAFKEFIKSYPIFTQHTKDTIEEGFLEGDIRLVRVSLQNDKESYEADFQFIKDGEKWKVWGIKIYTDSSKLEVPQDKESVFEAIKNQLDALKANDISKAYYAYSSESFQEVSSEEDFKKFVINHPVFGKNKSFEPQSTSFDRNMVTVIASLTGEDGTKKDVQYRLINTDGVWRILSIQMYTPSKEGEKTNESTVDEKNLHQKTSSKEIEFSKLLIGTKVDLQGIVTNPSTVFKSDKSELTANIYVQNGVVGESIEVVLEHESTKSSIPPVKVSLEKAGDSIVTFIFTPPSQGWPAGNYQLNVTSSSGVKKTFSFKVE